MVKLYLLNGLGYGFKNESVGSLTGPICRSSNSNLQVVFNSDRGCRHAKLSKFEESVAFLCYKASPSLAFAKSGRQTRQRFLVLG